MLPVGPQHGKLAAVATEADACDHGHAWYLKRHRLGSVAGRGLPNVHFATVVACRQHLRGCHHAHCQAGEGRRTCKRERCLALFPVAIARHKIDAAAGLCERGFARPAVQAGLERDGVAAAHPLHGPAPVVRKALLCVFDLRRQQGLAFRDIPARARLPVKVFVCDKVRVCHGRARLHGLPLEDVVGKHKQQRVDVHVLGLRVHVKRQDARVALPLEKLLLSAHLQQLDIPVKRARGCMRGTQKVAPRETHRRGRCVAEKETRRGSGGRGLPRWVVQAVGVPDLGHDREHGLHMLARTAVCPRRPRGYWNGLQLRKHRRHQVLASTTVKLFNVVTVVNVVQPLRECVAGFLAQKRAPQGVEARLPQRPHTADLAAVLALVAHQDTRGIFAQRHQALKQAVVLRQIRAPRKERMTHGTGKLQQPRQHGLVGPGHRSCCWWRTVGLCRQAGADAVHGVDKGVAKLTTKHALVSFMRKKHGRVRWI